MVRVQVHRTGTLTLAELVSVGEGILEHLHDRDDTGSLALELLDRGTGFADVRQRDAYPAAALRQLERVGDHTGDRLHVVLDAENEARDRASGVRSTGVQERRGRGLEAALNDLGDDVLRVLQVLRVGQSREDDAILEALEVARAVLVAQSVRGVELERSQVSREAELEGVSVLHQLLELVKAVLKNNISVPQAAVNQVVGLLLERVEEHGVRVHVLEEVGACRFLVLLELEASVWTPEIDLRVQILVSFLHSFSFLMSKA